MPPHSNSPLKPEHYPKERRAGAVAAESPAATAVAHREAPLLDASARPAMTAVEVARAMDQAGAVVFGFDLEGAVTALSSQAERLLGYRAAEVVGEASALQFFVPAEVSARAAELGIAAGVGAITAGDGDRPRRREWTFVRQDGSLLPVWVTIAGLRDTAGAVVEYVAIVRDRTSHRDREAAFARLRDQNRLILDSLGEGVYGFDLEGRTTFANPSAGRMVGYTADEMLGQGQHELIHHSHQDGSPFPRSECPIYAALRDGRVHRVRDDVFWRKDGSSFPVEYVSTSLREGDTIVGAVVIFRDITEQRRTQQALDRQTAALREQAQLLDLAHDAVLVRDLRTGDITFWNRGAEEMYGWSRAEAIGRVTRDLLRAEYPLPLEELEDILIREGRWEGELIHTTRSGKRIVVASRWALQRDDLGQPLAFLEINSDITEQKQGQSEQERLLRQAEAAEAQYRGLLDSAPDAIVTVDQAGTIAVVNTQTERLFGYPRDELIGKRVEDLLPERFRHDHVAHRESYSEDPHVRPMGIGMELRGRRKDGSEFPVEVSLSPVRIGPNVLVTAAIRDISERKRAEEEIRLLQSITMAVSEAPDLDSALRVVLEQVCRATGWTVGQAWTPAVDGTSIQCSPAWSSTGSGLEPFRDASRDLEVAPGQGLAGRVWQSAKPAWVPNLAADPHFRRKMPAEAAGLRAAVAVPVLAGQHVVAVLEFFSRRARPDDEWLLGTVSAVAAQLGVAIQRRQAEERLRETAAALERRTEELERSNSELEQFAYVASHDLQEPLRMVASYTQLLSRRYKGKLGQDADDFIGFAVDGANRMQALIQDLLAYSRVGTRGRPFEPTDTSEVFDQVLVDLGPAIAESGADVSREDLPTVMADPSQVRQLFQNLIGNAIKFRDTEAPRVQVAADREGAFWRFSVSDNGIGIEPQYAERIFVIFQRLHTQAEYPGTGIGLAICKKIVERHGGQISLTSTPGQGTTFTFTLPAATEGSRAG